MYPFIVIFCSLCFHICLYRILISMTTNCINIKSFCPKLASPKLLFYFWMKLGNLFRPVTFHYLDYPCWTNRWYALYQKMNMIFIHSDLNKSYFRSLRNLKTNLFKARIDSFRRNYPPIFGWTYKMIQQY
jgi:hypothetical protein